MNACIPRMHWRGAEGPGRVEQSVSVPSQRKSQRNSQTEVQIWFDPPLVFRGHADSPTHSSPTSSTDHQFWRFGNTESMVSAAGCAVVRCWKPHHATTAAPAGRAGRPRAAGAMWPPTGYCRAPAAPPRPWPGGPGARHVVLDKVIKANETHDHENLRMRLWKFGVTLWFVLTRRPR
jgi:hypothetical protein